MCAFGKSDSFLLTHKDRKHEITLGGGGNSEFEYYTNNRSNSYVLNSILYIKPTLTANQIGEGNVLNGFTYDLWGNEYNAQCTGNAWMGCERSSGGGNIINPIQSARLRTAGTFSFKYGRIEVRAKLPRGDWLWPAIWLLPEDQQYVAWPASGEIDLMESRGNSNGYPQGVDSFGSTLHYGTVSLSSPCNDHCAAILWSVLLRCY